MRFVAVRFLAVLTLVGMAFASAPVGAQSPSPALSQSPRPSASPMESVSPSPAPSPAIDPLGGITVQPGTGPTPDGLAWEVIASGPTQSKGTRFDEVVAWAGGFAMLEIRRPKPEARRTLAVWHSPDGRAWTRTELPRLGGALLGLQAYRDGLLIGVDQVDDDRRRMRVDIWRSPDAIDWRRVGSVVGRVPAALPEPWWIEPRSLIVAGDRLGLIARLSDDIGAGGWSPDGPQLAGVVGFAIREPASTDRLLGWVSDTGGRWTRTRVTGVTDATGPIGPNAIDQAPGSARALRDGASPALISSPDGTTWVDVVPLPAGREWGPPVGLLWADDASVLYLDSFSGRGGNRLDVWRLEPDGGWIATPKAMPASAFGGASDGADVVLVGQSSRSVIVAGGRAERPWGWVLVSRDGARSWDPELSGSAEIGSCFRSVAVHAGTAVLLACNPNLSGRAPFTTVPAIWVAELPS
jgi:hypothetical protein